MRCEKCPALAQDGYEYPEYFCYIGIPDEETSEDKNGNWGCRYNRAYIEKHIKIVNEEMRNATY